MALHDNNLIFEAFAKSRKKPISEDINSDEIDKKRKDITSSGLSDEHDVPSSSKAPEEKREVQIGQEIINLTDLISQDTESAHLYEDTDSPIAKMQVLAQELIDMHKSKSK